MIKILFLIALLTYSNGNEAGIKLAMDLATMTKLKDQLVPIIIKSTSEIVIGNINISQGPFDVSIRNIVFKHLKVPKEKVILSLLPASNECELNIEDISAFGTFNGEWKFAFASGNFDGTVKLQGAGSTIGLAITRNSIGGMVVKVSSCTIRLYVSNIDITISGGVIGEIINLLQKLFKPELVGKMRETIRDIVPKKLEEIINVITREIPTVIDLGDRFELSLKLPTNPRINKEYVSIGVEGRILAKGNTNQSSHKPLPYPDYDLNTTKGLQFFISDYILKTWLESLYEENWLAYAHDISLGFIDLYLDCFVIKPPVVNLKNDIFRSFIINNSSWGSYV